MINGCLIGQGSHSNYKNLRAIPRLTGTSLGQSCILRVASDVFHPPD